MAILRHQPCIHGKSKDSCPFCTMEAKLENLVDRVTDLEETVYVDPNPSEQITVVLPEDEEANGVEQSEPGDQTE